MTNAEFDRQVIYRERRSIAVHYSEELDGGGSRFGQEFISAIQATSGPVERLFEFCAGPGFIGFSLLSRGYCSYLTLADINPRAIAACQLSIEQNGLSACCSAYVSNALDAIPIEEKWDLVVGNPPHWPTGDPSGPSALLKLDLGLVLHRTFFRSVRQRLNPGGSILLQENGCATHADDFAAMVSLAGMSIDRVFSVSQCSHFYFIWCVPQ
jgi:16S rRNA G1207 methylase RsmC